MGGNGGSEGGLGKEGKVEQLDWGRVISRL